MYELKDAQYIYCTTKVHCFTMIAQVKTMLPVSPVSTMYISCNFECSWNTRTLAFVVMVTILNTQLNVDFFVSNGTQSHGVLGESHLNWSVDFSQHLMRRSSLSAPCNIWPWRTHRSWKSWYLDACWSDLLLSWAQGTYDRHFYLCFFQIFQRLNNISFLLKRF